MVLPDKYKNLPLNAILVYLCYIKNIGVGMAWLDEMDAYEKEVQFQQYV